MKKVFSLLFVTFGFILAKAQKIQSITYDIETLTAPKKALKLLSGNSIISSYAVKTEKSSIAKDSLVFFGEHPFLRGISAAYKEHRPFVISPDMIWLLISQGFARHVTNNSEALRYKIVDFEGKQKLTVVSEDIFLGEPNSNWEALFPQFEKGIKALTKNDLVENITADFTTTTPTSKIASQITLMESVKSYFDYEVITAGCGLPKITIEGTPEDWEKVLAKTKYISKYQLGWWTKELEPILEEIIKASKGKFKKRFWMNMVKFILQKNMAQRKLLTVG